MSQIRHQSSAAGLPPRRIEAGAGRATPPARPTPSQPQSPIMNKPLPDRQVAVPPRLAAVSQGRPSVRRCAHLIHQHARAAPQPTPAQAQSRGRPQPSPSPGHGR